MLKRLQVETTEERMFLRLNASNLLPSLYAGMAYAEGVPQQTITQNEITGSFHFHI